MPAWLLDLFARYGYAVVFAGVFLENTGLPVPGETALLAGAALAHFGQLSLTKVILDRDRRRDARRQPRVLHRPPRRAPPRRAPRLARRSDAGAARRVRSVLPAARTEDGLRRPLHHRAARGRRGARRRQRHGAGRLPVLQRDRRHRLVHDDRVCGILAGIQLGHARALDRADRPHRIALVLAAGIVAVMRARRTSHT